MTKHSRWQLMLILLALSAHVALAQPAGPNFNSTVPSQIMDQFRNQRAQWTANVFGYANALFGVLAVIEFAWSAAVMLLEKTDLQGWTSALIRKLMWIGAFYALLLNGRIWIPAIIDSFTQIGQSASGVGALSPSGVFVQGLSLAGALLDGASTSGFFSNPGTSLALAFAALIIVVSYTLITINFIVTLVESYLVVSVGFIFLGFGGSRWTAPYVERYIGMAVSTGIKILLVYCLIAAGIGLSNGWLAEAQSIASADRPAMIAFDVMGGALIFMMCCWQIPKLFASVMGGSPALTGGDLIGTAAAAGGAALAVGGAAVAGVGALAGAVGAAAGTGSAASAGGAGSTTSSAVASVGSVGSGSSSGGGSVPPPSSGSSGGDVAAVGGRNRQPDPPSGGSGRSGGMTEGSSTMSSSRGSISPQESTHGSSHTAAQPPAPTSALSSIGGEPLEGSGFETQSPQQGFRSTSIDSSEGSLTASVATTQASFGSSGDGSSVPAGQSPNVSGVASDVTSVGSTASTSPPPPTKSGARSGLARAANHVRGLRRKLGQLPSDAAPHATPPRMPIEHEE